MLEGFKGIYCKCVELPDLEQFKVKILEKLTRMIFTKEVHEVVLRLYRLKSYWKVCGLTRKLRQLRNITAEELEIDERIRAANKNDEFRYTGPEENKEDQNQGNVEDAFQPVISLF